MPATSSIPLCSQKRMSRAARVAFAPNLENVLCQGNPGSRPAFSLISATTGKCPSSRASPARDVSRSSSVLAGLEVIGLKPRVLHSVAPTCPEPSTPVGLSDSGSREEAPGPERLPAIGSCGSPDFREYLFPGHDRVSAERSAVQRRSRPRVGRRMLHPKSLRRLRPTATACSAVPWAVSSRHD